MVANQSNVTTSNSVHAGLAIQSNPMTLRPAHNVSAKTAGYEECGLKYAKNLFEACQFVKPGTILVDKEGRIRARDDDNGNNIGVYDGTDDYEVGLLIDDIKVLMAEYNLAKKNKDESKR